MSRQFPKRKSKIDTFDPSMFPFFKKNKYGSQAPTLPDFEQVTFF